MTWVISSRESAAKSDTPQFRRAHLPSEARLGLGTDHVRRHRRCADMVWLGCARAQRNQDRPTHRRAGNEEELYTCGAQ